MKRYVVGFCFDARREYVLLILKERPDWQRKKLNGVGGKIEGEETPLAAMIREFEEEAGLCVSDWREFTVVEGSDPVSEFRMHCFAHFGTETLLQAKTTTDEKLRVVSIESLHAVPCVPNIRWLIPMALSMKDESAHVFLVREAYQSLTH